MDYEYKYVWPKRAHFAFTDKQKVCGVVHVNQLGKYARKRAISLSPYKSTFFFFANTFPKLLCGYDQTSFRRWKENLLIFVSLDCFSSSSFRDILKIATLNFLYVRRWVTTRTYVAFVNIAVLDKYGCPIERKENITIRDKTFNTFSFSVWKLVLILL